MKQKKKNAQYHKIMDRQETVAAINKLYQRKSTHGGWNVRRELKILFGGAWT